jgi:hypothetical protein
MKIKQFTCSGPEGKRAYDYIIKTVEKERISLEEAILKSKNKFFNTPKYKKNKACLDFLLYRIYIDLTRIFKIKDYPPKNIREYDKFKKLVKKIEKHLRKRIPNISN